MGRQAAGAMIALAGFAGAAGYSVHNAHTSAQATKCAPAKTDVDRLIDVVNADTKAYDASETQLGVSSRQVLLAALKRDQDDLAVEQQVLSHQDCFPAADVAQATRWVQLLKGQVASDTAKLG